jgi:hypothetical protein
MASFTRQIGSESGVQLNPLNDNSEISASDNQDQVFAILMRATRGRIDKPFLVNRGNVYRKLGNGEQMRVSQLNEAWVHVVEALDSGAYSAVVQRLITSAYEIKYATAKYKPDVTELGSKKTASKSVVFSVDKDAPNGDFIVSVRHLECHNDGIKIEIHADEKKIGGVAVANDRVTLRLFDSADVRLYEFTGSLDPAAKDDYGNSAYLPDVVSLQTDTVEIETGVKSVDPLSVFYGYDDNSKPNTVKSEVLVCFTEGGMAYTTKDYLTGRENLQYTPLNYSYIAAGGTKAPALLSQLATLAFETNRQLKFDVPSELDEEAAIAFVEQLNFGASQTAHLLHAFWSPLKSNDPTGINPSGFFGVATLNIAMACGRNARVDDKGFAPKNYPIAGREWPIRRTRIIQTRTPRGPELNALARAKINPVLYETYTGGGRYVFLDSLTSAMVESSLKKLISVADMSTSVDDTVTRVAKDNLQLPMAVSIKRTRDFLATYFEGAQAAGWIVPSDDPAMGGAAWSFDVRPDSVRPYDRMQVSYSLRYDGTNRQTFVTHTLSR